MEESALERYFDKNIADNASHTEEEEEKNEEQFLTLLPDELLSESEQDERERSQDRSQDPAELSEDPYSNPRTLDATGQKLIPTIKNVISSVNLGCSLDLNYIAANAWNIKFNKRRFGGLNMMIRRPRATGIFHSSGKLVCLGAESVAQSKVAARRLARIVQKLGFPVRFLKFEVHSLTASCKTHPISLERMAAFVHCSYEPELFPGLFYSVMPGMSMMVHRSGVLSLSGAKTQAEIDRAFEIAQPIVNWFRK